MLEPTQPAIKYKALVGIVLESRMFFRNKEMPTALSYGHPEDLITLMFLSKAFPALRLVSSEVHEEYKGCLIMQQAEIIQTS
jgi:hypothetical protein